jgi:hypothetical protein
MKKRNKRILAVVLILTFVVFAILGFVENSYRKEALKSLDFKKQSHLLAQEGIPIEEYSLTKGNASIASWGSYCQAIFINRNNDKKFIATFTKSFSSDWKVKDIKWKIKNEITNGIF